MANQDPLGRSRYFHQASAFGISGQIDRPTTQTIPTQASVSLGPSGGLGTHRVDNYNLPGIVSCSAAFVETGGSLDDANNAYTTYASSVIENLNIMNVVLADRVVSRLTIYHPVPPTSPAAASPAPPAAPRPPAAPPEASFSIAGSQFDNLRISGVKIDPQLDSAVFHDSTYNGFCGGGPVGTTHPNRNWLIGSNFNAAQLQPLQSQLGHNYDILTGVAHRFQQWEAGQQQPASGRSFWCSVANQLTLSQGMPPGFMNFGGLISVPRFGVVCLAEMCIHRQHRHFTMLRVTMYSPAGGNIDGGGTNGGGTQLPPP